jgi:hypothetical protein
MPHMQGLLAIELETFRIGIEGQAAACSERWSADPLSGAVFSFDNRRCSAIPSGLKRKNPPNLRWRVFGSGRMRLS